MAEDHERRGGEIKRIEREVEHFEKEVEHEVELAEKALKKFSHTEAAHAFIGAMLAAAFFALVGNILVFGVVQSWLMVIAMNIFVLAILKISFYLVGWKHAGAHHRHVVHGTLHRGFRVYAVALFAALVLLSLARPGEWANPLLALKEVFALTIPAAIGGLAADIALSKPHGVTK